MNEASRPSSAIRTTVPPVAPPRDDLIKKVASPPRPRFLIILVLLIAFAAGVFAERYGWVPARASRQPAKLTTTFAPFWEAWDKVDRYYVDREKVDEKALTEGAIRGMLDALGDQGHTAYLSKKQFEKQEERLKGELEGIGASIRPVGREAIIARTFRGSPAREAKLRSGDVLVKVDGKTVVGLSLSDVVGKVRGPAGTEVKLSVRRRGQKKLEEIRVKRAHVEIPEVAWWMLPSKKGGPKIAHVAIASFSKQTDKQLRLALEEAKAAGAQGLILDLRMNPGGIKEQAVKVASEFLPEGEVVFIQKDARGNEEKVKAEGGGLATTVPLCVLIDRGSASSSEIVAGAIQDHGRGKLVGAKTFGTGTVLRQYKLSNGGVIWLAYYQWLTPKGRKIWHEGIAPDEGLAVALPREAIPLLPDPDQPATRQELEDSTDSQLRKALEWMEQTVR